jgi:hypothetical protein
LFEAFNVSNTISNTGVISGLRGIRFFGGNVLGDSVTGGGIVNRGTISASDTGVSVDHVNTIFGSVSNSGKILAPIGIVVKNSNGLVGVASAGAAINNNGTITESIDGILFENGVAAISAVSATCGAITARTGTRHFEQTLLMADRRQRHDPREQRGDSYRLRRRCFGRHSGFQQGCDFRRQQRHRG